MSKICHFAINNRLGYSDQLTIALKIIQIVCNGKTKETDEKIVEAQRNQSNSDNITNFKCLKFVSFL